MNVVVALSSAVGRAALAVVRLSGDGSFKICDELFKKKGAWVARKLYVGELDLKDIKDNAMAVRFSSPHSYTGEDMVEFHIHGSSAIVRRLIDRCIELGARGAEAGEFTRRAFLNGKLDLTRAEGIIDLIDSQTQAQAIAAYEQSVGTLFKTICQMQDRLTSVLAQIEVCIDYPEEDLALEGKVIENEIAALKAEIGSMCASFSKGRLIREGVRVVLAGVPNAGKSSLMNALLGCERAIVTNIAGTTRDVLTESYEHKGIRFIISDTAGLNACAQGIERIGVERAQNELKTADIILWLSEDANEQMPSALLPFAARIISVQTKQDTLSKPLVPQRDIAISSKDGSNLSQLKDLIFAKSGAPTTSLGILITNSRHHSALLRAQKCLKEAQIALDTQIPYPLLALHIKEAWDALGTVSGTTSSEEIINTIFSRFCVGK